VRKSVGELSDFDSDLEGVLSAIGEEQAEHSVEVVFGGEPDVSVVDEFDEEVRGGVVESCLREKLEEEGHEVVDVALDREAAFGVHVLADCQAHLLEVLYLFLGEQRVRVVLYHVYEPFTLGALLLPQQVAQRPQPNVLIQNGDLPLNQNPAALQLRPTHFALLQFVHFFFQQLLRGLHFVLPARNSHAVLAVAFGQQFGMAELFGRSDDIGHCDEVPAVLVHELEGGLEEVPEFELDEGVEGGEVGVVEARVCLCGADDAVDEVGIGYISHYARRGSIISGASCSR